MADRSSGSSRRRKPKEASSSSSSSHHSQSVLTPTTSITPASSFSLKSVTLHEWWLVKAEGKRIAVAGFASRERIDATTLETTDGIMITISGFINRSRTHQNGFSFLVCNRFLLGFPYQWEEFGSQCIEESANRGVPTRKTGFAELRMSSGTDANTYLPVSLDDLPVTRLRDLFMCLPEKSKNCTYDDLLGKVRNNALQYSPMAANLNMENRSPVMNAYSVADETLRNGKKARSDLKHKGDDGIMAVTDMEREELLAPSRGVVTRSMYRLKNIRNKQEENLPTNSSVKCKNFRNMLEKNFHQNSPSMVELTVELSASESGKNVSAAAVTQAALKESPATLSSRKDEAVVESTVRRSGRLKIRKNYISMGN